jgi:hypothetical protein
MTSPAQPRKTLSAKELANLVVKPQQPIKSVKGFIRDIQSPANAPQAKIPQTSSQPSIQDSLKQSYEQAKQELARIYKQEKRNVPRTPADQMVFVQSYKNAVELLETIYAQATGQQPIQSESALQGSYAQAIASLRTFYGQALQPAEALEQIKRLFYQVYIPVRKELPQSKGSQAPLIPAQDASQAKIPPPIALKPAPVAQPVPPAAWPAPASLDQTICRPWTLEEHARLQQAKHQQQSTQPRVSTPPAPPSSVPQTPPPIMSAQKRSPADTTSAPSASSQQVRIEDFRSQNARAQRDRPAWDPRFSRREYLLRERMHLEREIQRNLGKAEALNQQWQLWHERKARLDQNQVLVPVKEVASALVRRLIHIKIPSATQQASYRKNRLEQELAWLQRQAILINTHHEVLLQEAQIIDWELEMLAF